MREFQNSNFIKSLYGNENLIGQRGNFLKKYSNRKYSLRSFILKLIKIKGDSNVLDVGCGDCSFLDKLNKKYPKNKYFGLDITKNKKCFSYDFINYKIYDGINFPKYGDKFDFIFCMHTLYHVNDVKRLFLEMQKNIKNDGVIIITTKSKFTLPKIESIFGTIIKRLDLNKFVAIPKYRDESRFCLENGLMILRDNFFKKQFKIEEYILENQIITKNKRELLKYVFSTDRYNIETKIKQKKIIEKYKGLWEDYASKPDFFIDKYIEVIYVIKKYENRL